MVAFISREWLTNWRWIPPLKDSYPSARSQGSQMKAPSNAESPAPPNWPKSTMTNLPVHIAVMGSETGRWEGNVTHICYVDDINATHAFGWCGPTDPCSQVLPMHCNGLFNVSLLTKRKISRYLLLGNWFYNDEDRMNDIVNYLAASFQSIHCHKWH